jgi:hypothetical protein
MSGLLKSVRLIAVEIHDHMVDRRQIEALTISNGFLLSSDGDMTYGVNTGLIKKLQHHEFGIGNHTCL